MSAPASSRATTTAQATPLVRLVGDVLGRRARFPFRRPDWPASLEAPAPARTTGADYDSGWARRYPVRLARAVVMDNVMRPATHLVASPRAVGEEHLAAVEAPAIFVSNHSSHLDTPIVLSLLPARLRHHTVVAAAADHFFDRPWKSHLWAFALAAVPIERQRVNRRSADAVSELIEDGWSLLVYPEGGRSPDGWAREFRGGAAYLGVRTGRPVVPIHLSGTGRLLPKGGRLHRGRTEVHVGDPLTALPDEDARRFGVRIEAAVAALGDEARTDWWQARRRAAAATTPPLQGPDVAGWRRAWALGPPPDDPAEPVHDPGRWAVDAG